MEYTPDDEGFWNENNRATLSYLNRSLQSKPNLRPILIGVNGEREARTLATLVKINTLSYIRDESPKNTIDYLLSQPCDLLPNLLENIPSPRQYVETFSNHLSISDRHSSAYSKAC